MKKRNFILIIIIFLTINLYGKEGFNLITTISGESKGDAFSTVCGLGDINQDGYDDFAVGAWESNNGGGYVKIYFGGNTLDTIADLRLTGGSYFGWAMDSGDFNGDGIPDLIVSAPYANSMYGQVCIYFGGSNMDTIPDIVINGTRYVGFFGYSIANGGDINNDGNDDVIVGEHTSFDTRGYFYIFWGGPDIDNSWDYCLEGLGDDRLGNSCDGIGDINQDGYDDVIVGANTPYYGKAYIIYGDSTLNDSSLVEILGDTTKEYSFGRLTSGIGDINNDSIPEFVITSSEFNTNDGLTNIYSGDSIRHIYRINKNIGGVRRIISPIDFNNDNIDDLIIRDSDSIFAFIGRKNFNLNNSYTFSLPSNAVSSFGDIGDIDGDSKNNIAFGVVGGPTNYCHVYIYSFGELSDIKEEFAPDNFNLNQNYPNPFNITTTIKYEIPTNTKVTLEIFDITGKILIRQTEMKTKGIYEFKFNGNNLPSGMYLYRIQTKNFTQTYKMLLLK